VEREWLVYGHKFAERCGHVVGGSDPNEMSPVFIQWLDAVFQLLRQFPTEFEFNEAYLVSDSIIKCYQTGSVRVPS